jgi:hypothetical protein
MFRRTTFALLLLAAALASAPAAAQRKLGKTYEDKKRGYSLKVPDEWTAMPVKPGEKLRVGIFRGKNEDDHAAGSFTYDTELNIFVFPKGKGTTEAPGAAAAGKEEPKKPTREDLEDLFGPKDPMALLTKIPGAQKPTVKRIKVGDIETDEVVLAQENEQKFSRGGREGSYTFKTRHHAAIYHTGDADFVVHYSVYDKVYPKYLPMITASIQSFRVIPKELDATDLSKLSPEEQQRYKAKSNLAPGWYALDTARYVIKSNNKDKALVKDLGDKLEKIRDLYEEEFPSQNPIKDICVLVVCANEEDYFKYDAPRGSAGYWSSYHKELVIYNAKNRNLKDTYATLYHEGFHQYIYYSAGEIAPHDWFNEGHGDFFAGARLKDGKFRIEKFFWRTEEIRNALNEGTFVPLRKFLKYSHSDYYGPQIGQNYAQGWSIIFFLRKGATKPEWKPILSKYFETLKRVNDEEKKAGKREHEAGEKAREKALEDAFQGIDMDALEKAWIDFIK